MTPKGTDSGETKTEMKSKMTVTVNGDSEVEVNSLLSLKVQFGKSKYPGTNDDNTVADVIQVSSHQSPAYTQNPTPLPSRYTSLVPVVRNCPDTRPTKSIFSHTLPLSFVKIMFLDILVMRKRGRNFLCACVVFINLL